MPENGELTDYVATRWYRSPELLLNSRHYDKSVDLWATACIMGELIDCRPLFPGDDDLDQLYLIQRTLGNLTGPQLELLLKNPKFKGKLVTTGVEETIQARYRGKISPAGLDFMINLLKMDPKQRLTTEQALRHPYFEGLSPVAPSNGKEKQRPEVNPLMNHSSNTLVDNVGISRNNSRADTRKEDSVIAV